MTGDIQARLTDILDAFHLGRPLASLLQAKMPVQLVPPRENIVFCGAEFLATAGYSVILGNPLSDNTLTN